ncbi:MAG TPA: ParA family protein [Ilumatobacteraceae bacterium]|jgi:chromosome partitioning protein|nr:ParA family protein [Ilumatobacteraceae bacterium]
MTELPPRSSPPTWSVWSSAGQPLPTPAPPAPLGEVVTVAHTKGGAGKTSLTFNLAYALSTCGARVLVIDLDQQTGQSVFLGDSARRRLETNHEVADVGAVLLGRAAFEDALVREVHPNLDVLPADEESMGHAARQLSDPWVRSRLIDVLDAARADWDITLVDTPGHHSAVVTAALGGSSGAIVPMVPEAGPVNELPTILNTIRKTTDANGRPEVYGIIKMRVWGNSAYRRRAEDEIRVVADRYEVPLFRNKIPEDAKFGEAHLVGLPVGAYLNSARSATAYRHVAYELIQRRSWRFTVPDFV